MRTHGENRKATVLPALAVLALVLGPSPVARAGAGASTQSASGKGIKVHGNWTIDVLNADGSPASHHEFENALMPAGAFNLAHLLGKANSPGLWSVLLRDLFTPRISPFIILSENRHSDPAGGDLTVSVPTSGPNQDKLVLSGSVTSPDAREINRVVCDVTLCPTGSPACQPGTLTGNFTLREFATPIPVQAGQIVQVTVVFSFS